VITTGLAEAMEEALSQERPVSTAWLKQVRARWGPLYLQASLGQISADELWRQLLLGDDTRSLSAARMEARFLAAIHLREPDITQTLAALQARYRLGLLSNHVGRWARSLLDRFDLLPFFPTVVISSEVGARKPDPVPYQQVCHLMHIAPQQAAYVADEEEDLVGCQAVGMVPIFIAGQDALSRVGRVIERLSDLVGLY
jgi:HAD superfamily hydrolase (TIGR01509 family)